MSATNGRYKTKWIAAGKRDGVFEGRREAEKSERGFGAYCLAQKMKVLLDEAETGLLRWHLWKDKLAWKEGSQPAFTLEEVAANFDKVETLIAIAQDLASSSIGGDNEN